MKRKYFMGKNLDKEIQMDKFRKELEALINKHSIDNETNIPDYILSTYLVKYIEHLGHLINYRDQWFNFKPFDKKTLEKPLEKSNEDS